VTNEHHLVGLIPRQDRVVRAAHAGRNFIQDDGNAAPRTPEIGIVRNPFVISSGGKRNELETSIDGDRCKRFAGRQRDPVATPAQFLSDDDKWIDVAGGTDRRQNRVHSEMLTRVRRARERRPHMRPETSRNVDH
jgi:hypothetical protein